MENNSPTWNYILYGWYSGSSIEDAKLFGIFSSVKKARELQDTYYSSSNVKGFQLQRFEMDKPLDSVVGKTVYTEIKNPHGYYPRWTPATISDTASTA